jgi:tetratricopeptide (TPR) repeat protein
MIYFGRMPIGEELRGIEPEGKSYYYALVDEYLTSGQAGRALLQAARNIAFNTDDPVAHFNRARVYEKLGALGNAILDLQEALRISPDNEDAKTYLENLSKRIRDE